MSQQASGKEPKLKHLFYCRHCGHLLMKKEALVMLITEIRCPRCKKILTLPEDAIIKKVDKKLSTA